MRVPDFFGNSICEDILLQDINPAYRNDDSNYVMDFSK